MLGQGFTYYDLQRNLSSTDITLFFPSWQPGDERVVILSPHDDDALLGAGYLLLAIQASGGEVYILILCDGSAGYSTPAEKKDIIAIRRAETLIAYKALDVDASHILRCDYPDFSLAGYLGWQLPDGSPGTMQRILPELRRLRATRLLVPNGYREHVDHEAAERIGRYDGPQVGDPVLADLGLALPVRSLLQYAVWSDFSPEDALVHGRSPALRANRALLAPAEVEDRVMAGLQAFRSQARIIEGLVAARTARRHDDRWLELYLAFDPRPPLDYSPYHAAIRRIDGIRRV
ncbi:MAG: PIG-L family deacetylase [Anaerolineae bacterium]|nr:PIG-L family deacetylase [Anaerolineae bacterium]MDW8097950.1 PIG-L family deacetylase [Anaerolineae bacterium]